MPFGVTPRRRGHSIKMAKAGATRGRRTMTQRERGMSLLERSWYVEFGSGSVSIMVHVPFGDVHHRSSGIGLREKGRWDEKKKEK